VESVEAPLQETLASAICKIANIKEADVVCDPCCGSGTLAIEACLEKLSIPAGFYRPHFGFQHFKSFKPELFEEVKTLHGMHKANFKVLAFDKDPQAISACQANIENAGLEKYIYAHRIDLASNNRIEDKIDVIVTNPPFGKRLKIQSSFFTDLVRFLSKLKHKPKTYILLEEDQIHPHLPFKILEKHPLASGGLKLNLLKIDI
jgi:putative N6-adenine-specific DNA methylase